MRAILLCKDKEGLNNDRLKGRYGLTGKPALSKEGVASALATSFKAGQQVTLNNLRSLGNKLQEAQKALDNANNNIDETEKTQDDIEDAVDKINELLNVGIWEKFWMNKVDPISFLTAKWEEDIRIKVMAGEPLYAVVKTTQSMDTAPLPRTPYWDPLFEYGHIGDADRDTSLRLVPDGYLENMKDNESQIDAKFYSYLGVLSTASSAFSLATYLSSLASPGGAAYATEIDVIVGGLSAILLVVYLEIRYLLQYKFANVYIEEVLKVKKYDGSFPIIYKMGIFGQLNFISYGLINSTLNNALINITAISVASGIALGLTITGNALLPNPYTAAAGYACLAAATGILHALWAQWTTAEIDMITLMLSMISRETSVSNCNDTGIKNWPKILLYGLGLINYENSIPTSYNDEYSQLFRSTYDSDGLGFDVKVESSFSKINGNDAITGLLVGISGLSTQFKVSTEAGFMSFIMDPTVLKIINAIAIIAAPFSWIFSTINLVKIHGVAGVKTATTKISSIGSEIRLGETNYINSNAKYSWPLQDWFGRSTIGINSQAYDYKGTPLNITFAAGDIMCSEIRMYATVYNGNYFSKKWFKKPIYKTIVIRSKAEIHQNSSGKPGLWYGFMALVRFSGEAKLYLLFERNALYFSDYHIKHIEQMISNFPMETASLPVDTTFTYDRRGRLQYYYVEDQPGDGNTYNVQFRPVKSQHTNYLANEPINIEYNFDGDIELLQSPWNGTNEGGISSYCAV